MANKKQFTQALAEQTAHSLSESPEAYMRFLRTAAANYKYGFSDQILIHAQKPTATACATVAVWNKLGRWVKSGASGINLLPLEGNGPLRYIFDVSDTETDRGRDIRLWQLKPHQEDAVIQQLAASFGCSSDEGLAGSIMGAASNLAAQSTAEYVPELQEVMPGSSLEHAHFPLVREFGTLIHKSVSFMALARCGLDPEAVFSSDDFTLIRGFDTYPVISVLGSAVSQISEILLREIEGVVKGMEKLEQKYHNKEETRAYNAGKETERSEQHGADVHEGGRLQPAGSGVGAPEHQSLREPPVQVSAGTQGDPVQHPVPGREAEKPSGGDRQGSLRDGGAADPGRSSANSPIIGKTIST